MRTPYKYTRKKKIVGLHDRLKPRKYNVFMVGGSGERHLVATCDTLDDARRKRDVAIELKTTTAKDYIIVGSGCISVIDRG